jgi:hypothetical protein
MALHADEDVDELKQLFGIVEGGMVGMGEEERVKYWWNSGKFYSELRTRFRPCKFTKVDLCHVHAPKHWTTNHLLTTP